MVIFDENNEKILAKNLKKYKIIDVLKTPVFKFIN
jgi:hypothetical protein